MFSIKFGTFSAIVSSQFFLPRSLLSFWDSHYAYIWCCHTGSVHFSSCHTFKFLEISKSVLAFNSYLSRTSKTARDYLLGSSLGFLRHVHSHTCVQFLDLLEYVGAFQSPLYWSYFYNKGNPSKFLDRLVFVPTEFTTLDNCNVMESNLLLLFQ